MKIRPTLTAIAVFAASAPAAAMPACYADFGSGMVDLTSMYGDGGSYQPVAAPITAPPQTYTPVATGAAQAPLPQLVNYELRGDELRIELRNPAIGPTQATTISYSLEYWVGDDYRTVDGTVAAPSFTASSDYIRLNIRRQHAEVDSAMDADIPVDVWYVNVLRR